ncbi:hypothetical protein BGZ63DRAFT_394864 [Mariannaea sp. PMI_226]|nr:hypothetical protein BGZ63DRAFT_394864 [Mariannaea sp. PMI_226]
MAFAYVGINNNTTNTGFNNTINAGFQDTTNTGFPTSSPALRGFGQPSGRLQGPNAIEPAMIPLDELRLSLDKLFTSGSYSDLTILCGEDRYQVHKAVICPRSDFFEAICNSSFKEANTGEIDLPDDDSLAVKMMIQYFYRLDYSNIPASTPVEQPSGPPNPFTSPEINQTTPSPFLDNLSLSPASVRKNKRRFKGLSMLQKPPSNLNLHAKVYALGEKYGIKGLKALAVKKFEDEVVHHWDSADFLLAIQEVYTSTVDHDRPMRDAVVATFSKHGSLLDKPSVQDVVKGLELSFDLLMQYRKKQSALE